MEGTNTVFPWDKVVERESGPWPAAFHDLGGRDILGYSVQREHIIGKMIQVRVQLERPVSGLVNGIERR